MSLDVFVNTKCETCDHMEEHGSFNYTYNVGQLWLDALEAGGVPSTTLGEFLERKGKEGPAIGAVDTLDRMLAWMGSVDLSKYDAPNGWGTGAGGRDFVKAIADCCREHPKATLSAWR